METIKTIFAVIGVIAVLVFSLGVVMYMLCDKDRENELPN
jgi:cbb3-type cytochrome oxidase subunit 3